MTDLKLFRPEGPLTAPPWHESLALQPRGVNRNPRWPVGIVVSLEMAVPP